MKKACITGVTGREGSYLAELLEDELVKIMVEHDLKHVNFGGSERILGALQFIGEAK